MKKAEEDKSSPLGQSELDTYDAAYQFGVRSAGKLPQDPVEKEAYKLAEAAVIAALKARGTKLKELPEGKLDELTLATLEKRPHFREQAAKVIAARKEAVAGAGVDLGDTGQQQAAQ
jgi:lambda repressor-like predicted transcriptional regulator